MHRYCQSTRSYFAPSTLALWTYGQCKLFFGSSWFFVFATVAAFAALAAARASRSNQILDGFRRGAIGIHAFVK